jgi:hypothetical protein
MELGAELTPLVLERNLPSSLRALVRCGPKDGGTISSETGTFLLLGAYANR